LPKVHVVLFRDERGHVPFYDWFEHLPDRAKYKCTVRLERLGEFGHELRRPEADILRKGIHELRSQHNGVNYRMLYFFHGQKVVVVSHGIVKQRAEVAEKEIELALRRKSLFESDPNKYTAIDDLI
jgi:phage-related protein